MRNIVWNALCASALLITNIASVDAAVIFNFDSSGMPQNEWSLSGTDGVATIGITVSGPTSAAGTLFDVTDQETYSGFTWLLLNPADKAPGGQSFFVAQGIDVRALNSPVFGGPLDLPNGGQLGFVGIKKSHDDGDDDESLTTVPEAPLVLLMLAGLVPVYVRFRRFARVRV